MRPKRRLKTTCSLTLLVALLMVASCFVIVTTTPIRFLLTPWTPEPTLSPLETQTPFILLTVVGPLGIDTRADLERYLRTSLPADISDLEFADYNIAIQEAAISVRFKSNKSTVELFLEEIGFSNSLEEYYYPSFHQTGIFISNYFDWWKPEEAKIYSGGQISKGSQEFWMVLVDKTNPESYIVYLMMLLL
ncbi:MAG: hypothetical protein LCI00_32360 [Chloroflexi bacterium]|nr:hypothetical protein [Chloroflexota bacterium]MCC6894634.1 hypothetical protein [Anaerolineae bacterium]